MTICGELSCVQLYAEILSMDQIAQLDGVIRAVAKGVEMMTLIGKSYLSSRLSQDRCEQLQAAGVPLLLLGTLRCLDASSWVGLQTAGKHITMAILRALCRLAKGSTEAREALIESESKQMLGAYLATLDVYNELDEVKEACKRLATALGGLPEVWGIPDAPIEKEELSTLTQ